MKTLGLFKLSDITTEKLVFKNIDEKEFVKRLSTFTDSSTNVGFLTGRNKFHGLINDNNFRLKRIRTGDNEGFIVIGKIMRSGTELIVELEIKRGIIPTLLPTIIFTICILIMTGLLKSGRLELVYIPFVLGVIGIWLLDQKRTMELKKVKRIFYALYKPNE